MNKTTISFVKNKKTYISKPFDFEAMCLINDEFFRSEKAGNLRMCNGAVDYLFDGTEATADVMKSISVSTRTRLCTELWHMYMEALTSSKNE